MRTILNVRLNNEKEIESKHVEENEEMTTENDAKRNELKVEKQRNR